MEIFLGIDDTDNLTSPGTGHLLEKLRGEIELLKLGKTSRITRHQLFVHPKVPYTSHNSAMCCSINMEINQKKALINYCKKFLIDFSAEGADPGLCVLDLSLLPNSQKKELINFGQRAKKEVLTKKEAYALAKKINLHLSEHGGTGDGVIGALAGVGLRLSGNDGRYKGWFTSLNKTDLLTVEELCLFPEIDEIRTFDKEILAEQEKIFVQGKLKTIHLFSKSILLVEKAENKKGDYKWQSCPKEKIKLF